MSMRALIRSPIAPSARAMLRLDLPFLRWAIPALALTLAPLAGYAIAAQETLVLLAVGALIAGVAGLRLAMSRRASTTALYLILLTALLLGFFTLPTGRESRLAISMLIALGALATWGLGMVVRGRFSLEPSPINRPAIAFVLINIVSYVWSLLLRDPGLFIWSSFPLVQLAALTLNISLPLLLLFAAHHIKSETTVQRLVLIFLGIASLGILLYFAARPLHDFLFARSSRGLFSMWAAALALGLAFFLSSLRPWQRAVLVGLVVALIYRFFVLGQSWISGWLPMMVACGVILLLYSRRLFLLVVLVCLVYIAVYAGYYYQHIVLAEEAGGSGTGRVQIWLMNLQHIRNHPLFGMGPAGYAIYNMTYHAADARSTHNNYFDVLSQVGVVGFGAFLWLWATLLRIGRSEVRRARNSGTFREAFTVAAYAGCFGALAAMMLGDWVLPFAYNETISGFDHASLTWLFLGCIAALARMEPAPALKSAQAGPEADAAAGGAVHMAEAS